MGSLYNRHQRLMAVVVAAFLVYMITVLIWHPNAVTSQLARSANELHRSWQSVHSGDKGKDTRDKDLSRVSNETLGFEKVMVIGLPERSDKRDAVSLMASLSGFKVDWVKGVKQDTIPDKAVPYGIDRSSVSDNFLGCWRGHLDAIRHVVESGASSALIMEDDVDWDAHIKDQLHDIALGARHIIPDNATGVPDSPYGDDWDILWLGHCGELFPETLEENRGLPPEIKAKMSTKYIIHNDDTVPPYSKVSHLVDWSEFPPHTRIVHVGAAPICLFAYAISQRAARTLLYAMSIDGLSMAVDNAMANLCRDSTNALARGNQDGYRLKCLSVNPAIVFHHKPKGRISGDSDIQSYGKDGAVREKGFTETIKWSMRLNLGNLLTGRPLEPQFKDDDEE